MGNISLPAQGLQYSAYMTSMSSPRRRGVGNRRDMTVTDSGGTTVHVYTYSLIKIKKSGSLPERTLGRALNNRWPSPVCRLDHAVRTQMRSGDDNDKMEMATLLGGHNDCFLSMWPGILFRHDAGSSLRRAS